MTQVIRYRVVCVASLILCSLVAASAETAPSDLLYGPGPETWVFSQMMLLSSANGVRARGYIADSLDDLKRAITEAKGLTPLDAAILLAYKDGPKAIPEIRTLLDDQRPLVHCMAARLMAILGDQSGLDKMRKIVGDFTRDDQEEASVQRLPGTAHEKENPYVRTKTGRLSQALSAAQVLAEFGDSSGYRIAAEAAVEGNLAAVRRDAIAVITELGRIHPATLRSRGLDVEAVLLVVADSEADPHLLESLCARVKGRMRPEASVKVLDKLQRSPHLSPQGQQIVAASLKEVRKRLERE